MISQLSAKYLVRYTADTTDGKVTNLAVLSAKSEKVHRLYLPNFITHSDTINTSDIILKFKPLGN